MMGDTMLGVEEALEEKNILKSGLAPLHSPVLREEVLAIFQEACAARIADRSQEDFLFLDGTFGRGGHSAALKGAFPQCRIVAMDRDAQAIEYGKDHPELFNPAHFGFLHTTFSQGAETLTRALTKNLTQVRKELPGEKEGADMDRQKIFWENVQLGQEGGAAQQDLPQKSTENFRRGKNISQNVSKGAFQERPQDALQGVFHGILLDLGVSSPQIDTAQRGFSFSKDGPLDMTMGLNHRSAFDVVNTYSVDALGDIFFYYGQEPKGRRIARAIVARRGHTPIVTTVQLANLVESVLGPNRGKSGRHPATKVFQALRIEVNQELQDIQKALPLLSALLVPGGCLVAISFHSLEDRLVKDFFFKSSIVSPQLSPYCYSHSKKPIAPLAREVQNNPRSSCAKLRWGLFRHNDYYHNPLIS